LKSGFKHAKGQVIVTLDGDLQDDPAELARFLKKIEEGYDFISGKRINVPFPRVIFSRLFNLFLSTITGVKISDANCGFKAFRRELLDVLPLYGELQRFLPVFASKNGYRVTEIEITHNERYSGHSKYNWARIPKGFIDLLTVLLLTAYHRRPLHLFGLIGLFITSAGGLICFALTLLKILTGTIQGHNTLLLMGVMLIIFGFQWISAGLLGEMVANLDEEFTS
jgi:glycosyltransferase involved in cell wall biosynthesis